MILLLFTFSSGYFGIFRTINIILYQVGIITSAGNTSCHQLKSKLSEWLDTPHDEGE